MQKTQDDGSFQAGGPPNPIAKMDKRRIFLSRLKRKILKHTQLVRLAIVAGAILTFFGVIYLGAQSLKKTSIPFYLGLARDFIFAPGGKIKTINNRTNILILGKGGQNHEAPDLTDTIIFVSFNHLKSDIKLISLPRDIWIQSLRAKLNSVYYWGNQRKEGGGIILTKAIVEEVVGQPVSYATVLDFSGFKNIIDVVGGIEVNVERGFIDEKYPIPGKESDLCGGDSEYKCRYETLRFVAGRQTMDGNTALKFVRSRNAEGEEGTDLAREVRQQKVISAIKSKVLGREVLLSPRKLIAFKNAIFPAIETDIASPAAAIIARRLLQSRDNVFSYVLPDDLLVNPPKSPKYDNLYVFIPKETDWGKVHEWMECILADG